MKIAEFIMARSRMFLVPEQAESRGLGPEPYRVLCFLWFNIYSKEVERQFTNEEIADHCILSVHAVEWSLAALEKQGFLTVDETGIHLQMM